MGLEFNVVEELTAASFVEENSLSSIERQALLGLRSLMQRHLSSLGVTAALNPAELITDQMEADYLALAVSLWDSVETITEGFGLDILPFEQFYPLVKEAIQTSRNRYIEVLKSLIGKQAENTPIYGEFFFIPDHIPHTGLKPPAAYEVQFGDIRSILGELGGGGPAEVPLATGITGGRIFQEVLTANGLGTTEKLWLYGETARRTFNGHLQIDGLVFTDWEDPALDIAPQDYWLRTAKYRPGDHWGCACVVVPYVPNFGAPIPMTIQAAGTVEFYSPSEPRDKDGQWTATGGSVKDASWSQVHVSEEAIRSGLSSFKGPHGTTAHVSQITVQPHQGGVQVVGSFLRDGKTVGTFERTYLRVGETTRTPHTVVRHDDMVLTDTGLGVGKAFLEHSIQTYRQQGIQKILIEATSNGHGKNGAYTWAKLGFRPQGSDRVRFLKEAAQQLKRKVHSMDDVLSTSDGIAWLKSGSVRWNGELNLSSVTAAAQTEEFYSPSQARDKEGRWTAHRGQITSLASERIDRAYGRGTVGVFGNSQTTTPVPWPSAPRQKGKQNYKPELVQKALSHTPPLPLERVDPRLLYATQPNIVRSHFDHYMDGNKGLAADHNAASNAQPIVYVNAQGQHLLLTGHHRAAVALANGEDFSALVVRE